MSNVTAGGFSCPAPFLDESKYPLDEGYLRGRICAMLPGTDVSCCIPCPATQYLYPDDFMSLSRIPGYVSMGSFALCAFMLLAYAILPPEMTKRHYLNTCVLVAILLLELGLAIPVLVRPEECTNDITPNDMRGSMTCAWSGALLIFGGCAGAMWVLARVVSMHLLICWDVKPNRVFFWGSQLLAWGMTTVLTAVCLAITGVSFRFGDYCHVNNYKGLQTLWGPMLGFAALSGLLQAATFVYCIKVYVQSIFNDKAPTYASEPSTQRSMGRTQTAQAIYRRVRSVLALQWRSMLICGFVLVDTVYLAAIFIDLNQKYEDVVHDVNKVIPWATCIITRTKEECLPYTQAYRPSEGAVIAIMFLLSIVGVAAFLLIGRLELITGWFTVFRDWREQRKQSRQVYLDDDSTKHVLVCRGKTISRPQPIDEKNYPLLTVLTPATTASSESPHTAFTSPVGEFKSPESAWTPINTTRSLSPRIYQDTSPVTSPTSGVQADDPVMQKSAVPHRPSIYRPTNAARDIGVRGTWTHWDPVSTFAKPDPQYRPQ